MGVCACMFWVGESIGVKGQGQGRKTFKDGERRTDSFNLKNKRHNCFVPLVKQVTTAVRQVLIHNIQDTQELHIKTA